MKIKLIRTMGVTAICSFMMAMQSFSAFAAQGLPSAGLLNNYKATILAESVDVKTEANGSEVLTEALQGATFQVSENVGNGWVSVDVGGEKGYLPVDESISIIGPDGNVITDELQGAQSAEASKDDVRQNVVDFALQFVGGRYRYGGNDPHTGVDCSGFTRYVLQNGAGIPMSRSASSQSTQGQAVSAEQMRPGDLVFYSSGRSINHVAMYIGNGQVVHSSTYKTGIKTSPWNYRTPVKIVNVIGD